MNKLIIYGGVKVVGRNIKYENKMMNQILLKI